MRDYTMLLETLGWDAFFAEWFEPFAAQGLVPGRVGFGYRGGFRLLTEVGEIDAEITGRLRHEAAGRHELPVVGDWVVFRPEDGSGRATIQAILPRRTRVARKVPGAPTEQQVLVANVDVVLLVVGLDDDFNPRRIERALTMIWESGARPVIVLNKADRCADLARHHAEIEQIAIEVPVHTTCAITGDGVDALNDHLKPGLTVVLLGSSGVGKSTLINRLLGVERQRTAAVRARDSRGRHTTTTRELITLPNGALLIDTPGLRELQLWEGQSSLRETFADIEALATGCRFADCRHQREPGCAVREAVQVGRLPIGRLENYLKLQGELEFQALRQDGRADLVQRKKRKAIHKSTRSYRSKG